MKRQVRKSKFDPLVDEVELIEANPKYAHVRYSDGREDTVATKFLAPQVDRKTEIHDEKIPNQPHVTSDFTELIDVNNEQTSDTLVEVNESNTAESMPVSQELHDTQSQQLEPLRRSQRVRKSPDRLVYV